LLRIEPARKKREESDFECVAENGVGDPVTAKAKLEVYDGKFKVLKNFFPSLPTKIERN
jgi:hypothetical protein